MKFRRIFAISMTFFSLFLAACSTQTKTLEPLTQEYGTVVGEFKSLGGIKVDSMITHLFEDEDGNIYYAFSERYNLDNELSKPVEAAGLIMNYEGIDKPAFKITRISDAPEQVIENVEVKIVDYIDTELGFSMRYPDNWKIESFRDSVKLTAPIDEQKKDESFEPDIILIAYLDSELRTTSDNESSDRKRDIATQVAILHPDLADIDAQVSMIGSDQQFALRYKKENGSIYYFIPRGQDLIELSFSHISNESPLENSNIFSELVSEFRLLPISEGDEFIIEEGDANEEKSYEMGGDEIENSKPIENDEALEESIENEKPSDLEQESVESFREFESNPYKFTMSYPSSWYYSGKDQGYDFSDEPFEDDTQALIRLDISSSGSEGLIRSGDTVSISIEIEDRYYIISGPANYESIMQSMIESISPVEEE